MGMISYAKGLKPPFAFVSFPSEFKYSHSTPPFFYLLLMDASPCPDSQHTSSNATRRPRRVRTRLYGYILTRDWINDFAARKQIGTPGHYLDTSSKVVGHILHETRFRRAYAAKWRGSVVLCIAIAHNNSAEGLRLATPERIERVKRVMEVDVEPSWFNAV